MSTRCQMGFYQEREQELAYPDALIYQHSDGYPGTDDGILAMLTPLLRQFEKERGFWDAEYAAAYVLAQSMQGVTGHGVTQSLHDDIAFFYAVRDRRISVYTTVADSHTGNITYEDLREQETTDW